MLYLLNEDVRTVRWNGESLHEATSAIVKETMNGDFTLTVKYPISDSGIYQLIQEDMLIKAPTPVLGAQLFRIKKPVEHNDHLEITAYHISDDVMQRSITQMSVTSQSCGMALSRMVQNTKTALGDFSFNSDIQDRRTFNTTETETLYSVLLDGKHSIVGTWEGELVRDNFAMTVKKSRGENRGVVITTHKNLKDYQRTKNSQNVVTRIHAKSTFKPEGAEKETTIRVTVDSPLINSYPYINEKEYENNNAKTVEELQKWAQSKFSNEGIDKVSDAIKIEAYELDGQVVHMGDTVNLKSWKHNVDAFKKAIAYEFDALKEEYISLTFDDKAGIGGSRASGGLSSAADAILGVTESAQEIALEKALQNADLDFDHKAGLLRQEISDDIELAKARAEEVKRELSDTINQRFNSFDNGPLKETKRKAEEALRNAGASSSLAQESKRIGLDSVARLEAFKSQTTSAQTALSGDLDALKRTIANDIRPKQAQAEAEIAKQVEALSRTKNELAGASTLLAQEAKRIELDSVARLEAFKSQTTSAQTALSGDLDALKRTIVNDIRPKQAQAEAEIAKQVEALSRTKNELAGVKSAQATYKETTTRRLSELTNLANGKASKSELTQTAEELSSKIASVQASGRNLFLNSLFKQDIPKTGIWTTSTYTATIDSESKYLGHKALKIIGLNPSGRDGGNPKVTYPALGQFGKVIPGSTTNQDVTISFYAKANKNGIMLRSRLGNIGYKTGNVTLSTEIKRYAVHIPKGWTNESKRTTNEWLFNFNQEGTVWIWMPKFEISDVDTSYSEAPEDIEGQISTVESTFKQRANSLEAGVSRLTEGLRTKADISSLNVTAENIRQSVKSLETDTQNKLNQKLSQAEFEVRAGSIRQEILNATKDKADKTLVVSEAGKLREEFSKMKVGGRNLWIKSKTVGAVIEKLPENHVTGQKECYRLENNSTLTFNLEPDFSSRLYQKVTFSAWIKYENVVQGRNFWNVFNCFKHYLFRKNSETGVQSGPDYDTLGRYKGSADWKYITFTYDYSEKTNFDQLKTSLRFNLEGATSGTAWVTGIKVEIGSVATDWSPAPEDADGLITEAKATFERTAQGLRTDLSAIQEYVNKDGQRQEALQRYTREESTRQATAVRELVNRDFVGKATYQEDVKGINQRIEAVKTSANKDIASQIASYRQSVDGKFTDISSQITTYKQDVGGQISGLSNRLTSSEQGTTTQISNLSNRINSNKQGTDNQISNLKTQVATNKDNAERQMGRISDQVSANKANADSQFANVTNQLARKVETTDFQRVKETSKLYERILGNTENGIADKVARMALTNQLFQVEVAKNASNGQNLLKGTKDFSGGWKNKGANWKKHAEKYKGVDVLFKNNSWNGVGQEIDAKIGEVYTFSLWMKSDWKNDTVNFYVNRNGSVEKGWGVPSETSVAITSEWKRYSFAFKITVDGFIFPRVERLNQNTNLYIAGLKLEKGSYATPYTEAPEDTDEAIRSVQSQLTGSWAVQNINSAGDIISGINLGANGHNRFVGKLTHITGETLIDRAVIKSAMVDKLKTANFEAGSVTTTILDAEAVTADKVRFDAAFIRKMTANDAFIDQLTSKRIFSTKVESVISSSTFLEAYQGRIGGFTIGRFAQGRGRWISGINQFSVGMGNGEGGSYNGENTAFWANWGHSWNSPGPNAWYVTTSGNMYCRNGADFHGKVDFSNSSRANFYGNTTFSRSPVFSNGIELGSKDVLGDGWNPKGGRNAVVWWNQVGSGSVKYWMEQKSDRRLKENITDTAVKALDKINRLRMVAFDFIENKKHEEIGLIAQEAETIVPRIVSRDPENPDGYLHIDYTALVPYLIKAIQELNQKIEKMEKTIA
ncbi:phage hyaluronidase [Streptococcus pneumoniae]|uniref:phage tail spike protein n=1 Tax=Streptococcus pneumoniae TaxID=1313 RepID=UPI0007651168|nr:phage tail spike protein [Streptococcus pneumoniae]APD24041.1 hyaluronidase [Streptococcus phage IPP58]CVM91379.1 phage hyaluronidase [Streptococcus pneumoniae]CVR12376.1 phage hyaluronidase [Streptococcus pneumoniae]CWL50853.1 phage hyaluronidase [Streptococcus pneumoniae]VMK46849.1 phage hyaluronidase [Streptococcus pneumoniae]